MIKLGVNIDHVATLRQARGGVEPSVIDAAFVAKKAGADSLTIHLREDRRHIQDKDLYEIKKKCDLPLNLEMSLNKEIVEIALRVKPYQVTLVPEKRQELTTEGGLDVLKHFSRIKRATERLKSKGIIVSLFIDPIKKQTKQSYLAGVDAVEFHTGTYAEKFGKGKYQTSLKKLFDAAKYANELGLQVNAGHGLNYENVLPICKMPYLYELNIGHSIVSRAVFDGLSKAIKDMRKQMCSGSSRAAR